MNRFPSYAAGCQGDAAMWKGVHRAGREERTKGVEALFPLVGTLTLGYGWTRRRRAA
jgi:hypothetical protein